MIYNNNANTSKRFLNSNVSIGVNKTVLLGISQIKSILPLNLPRVNKNYLVALIDGHIIHYPSPITLTYAWSFGSLAGICLVIQMFSGIFLAMHYTSHIDLAFNSVEYIMRDVNNGWLIRYIHANGASMFFILVYSHICRGLYYGSYMEPRELLWCSGVLLFFLMMGTAFTGYVLPWGQMSFWGATVITSMVTAIPIAGQPIVQWLWGGYTVGNPTLNRFFSIHFFLPFLIAGLSLVHLALLHKVGSNNPIGSDTGIDDIPFYPYFVAKDLFAFFSFMLFFATFVFYFPNILNHPDNYIPADPLQTPAHVVPEWYFLPYYAILRSIPHKVGGIIAMGGAILVLFAIPYINTSDIRNTTYRPIFKFCFWFFISDFIILTWVGQKPVKNTFIFVGQIATFYYFFFFLVLIPVVGKIESALVHYKSESNFNKPNVKLINKINLFVLILGLFGCYFKYYMLVIYAIIHFLVLLGKFLSKNFEKKLENFKNDQITIKKHYIESFKTFYYFAISAKLITFLFYIYFFMLIDLTKMSELSTFFYTITYIFIIVLILELGITLYIILYKNTPTTEVFINVCYHCVTKLTPALYVLHTSCNVPIIAPNPISNAYHTYSPLGRGYGVHSSGQLFKIDFLKTHLGSDFKYEEIVDSNKMVCPKKLQDYAAKNNLDLSKSNPFDIF